MRETLPVSPCAYCGREVTVAHRANECRHRLSRTVKELQSLLTAAEEERVELGTERDLLRSRVLELETARRDRNAVLTECRDHILCAGHLSPRCEYHGVCRCDMEALVRRIDHLLPA